MRQKTGGGGRLHQHESLESRRPGRAIRSDQALVPRPAAAKRRATPVVEGCVSESARLLAFTRCQLLQATPGGHLQVPYSGPCRTRNRAGR
ncbi:hypothetical protein V5799_006572 [Amblyomma americanum]|uniref:Uncharacterized protein n=1 Tax=Amblyomma americanum TaxID=6943 RepID=A0AAQ4DW02_AMBAM